MRKKKVLFVNFNKKHKRIILFNFIEISLTVAQGVFPLQQLWMFLSGMGNEVVVWWRLVWEI